MDFKKGDKVYILDFPFGRPLNIVGEIVGKSGDDYYSVLLENGLLAGDIKKYKYWKLVPFDKVIE
jgi:hypothetical protein|tara:strand:- start:218 stop:412 length:195 start_codon:yes stop_codon:yes gene_type:complete